MHTVGTTTHVTTSNLAPLALHGHTSAPVPIDVDGDAKLDALFDGLDGDGRLLVVSSRSGDERLRRRLETAQAAMAGRREVVRLVTDLPPLAARVLGALAGSLAPLAPSTGVLVDGLRLIEHELIIAAVLPTVLRLQEPSPSFAQRMRSLLPGGAFLARLQPDPAVVAIDRNRPVPEMLDDADPTATGVVICAPSRLAWAAGALADAFPDAHVTRVDPESGTSNRWGTANSAEAVAYPTDAAALAAELFAHPGVPCPWCGEPVTTVPCPICGHDRNRNLAQEQSF
jgi:hypothetical protein